MEVPTKRCPRCKQQKSVFDFYKNASKHDGLHNYCKLCEQERQKTPEARNAPSNRKAWADRMFQALRLNDSDY